MIAKNRLHSVVDIILWADGYLQYLGGFLCKGGLSTVARGHDSNASGGSRFWGDATGQIRGDRDAPTTQA